MKQFLGTGFVRAVTLALLVAVCGVRPGAAADGSPRSPEYLIKAAYLYNFAIFVDWPADAFASPDSPFVMCVVGPDPFGWALDRTVADKRIGQHRLAVQRLTWNQDPRACHLAFVSEAEPARLAELVDRVAGGSTLVVADGDRTRAAINLVVRDNKVGFEISLEHARRARVTIGSKLLSLARVVR